MRRGEQRGPLQLGILFVATVVVALDLAGPSGPSSATSAPGVKPPTNISPPSIQGDAQQGQILRAQPGRWRLKPNSLEFSYQWELCTAAAAVCTRVPRANDRIYVPGHEDIGRVLRVAVIATNKAGSGSPASSGRTALVRAAPESAPQNVLRPTIAGTAETGEALTAQAGTWTGSPPIRVRYQWRRCDEDGGACDDVDREGATYALRAADVGHALRVLVIAENSVGTSAALSDPTAVAGPIMRAAPRNTSPPRISGMAQEGKTLTASTGSWSGIAPIAFSFQWLRCATRGLHCASISGATAQGYPLGANEVRHRLRVRVKARNAVGASSAVSAPTEAVLAGLRAPVNTSTPTVSGAAREGSVLTASSGAWTGAQPIRFSFQWLRCDASGTGCGRVTAATGQTRTLTSADVGRTMRVRVTATNAAGSSSVLSSPSAIIARTGDAPRNAARPGLSGSALQRETLRLSTGSWAGTHPIAYSYEWIRCGPSLDDCISVKGATGDTYVVSRADVEHRLFGVVTARNRFGSSRARSNATSLIAGVPVNTALPTIAGSSREGERIIATPGGWKGPGPIGFFYQWTRCTANGDFHGCVPIVVTPSATYRLTARDVGHRVFVQVKAQNRFGASFANSARTSMVAAAPVGPLTIRSAKRVVTYGSRVVLSGALVSARIGQGLSIVERPVGAGPRVHHAITSANGAWRYVVRPRIRTSYQAQVEARASTIATVFVRPRVRFGRVARGKFLVRVYAARQFGGRQAVVQQWSRSRHRWVRVRRISLRASGIGVEPTVVSGATFRMRARPARMLRVVLPNRQTGAGYLQGVSNRIRV